MSIHTVSLDDIELQMIRFGLYYTYIKGKQVREEVHGTVPAHELISKLSLGGLPQKANYTIAKEKSNE